MTSSQSSSNTRAASRTYRWKALTPANIFIDVMPESRIPEFVTNLEDQLLDITYPNSGGIVAPSFDDLEASLQSKAADDTLSVALRLARHVKAKNPKSYYGLTESKWMNLNKEVLYTFLHEDPIFFSSEDEIWDAGVGPTGAEGYPLSVPKPDIGLGLRVLGRGETVYEELPPSSLITRLKQDVLDALSIHSAYRLIASPSASLTKMVYPFFIFEAKSDSSPISFAVNQAAGGTAKALALLNDLCRLCDIDNDLPVFALATQGAFWEVYICFYENENDAYHLKSMGRLFDISRDGDIFYLQVILCRIKEWTKSTYLPKIEDCIARLYEGYLEHTHQSNDEH